MNKKDERWFRIHSSLALYEFACLCLIIVFAILILGDAFVIHVSSVGHTIALIVMCLAYFINQHMRKKMERRIADHFSAKRGEN